MSAELKSRYICEHIPRTGGTSLRRFWTEIFPLDQINYYYDGGFFTAAETVSPVLRHPFLAVIKNHLTLTDTGRTLYRLIKRTLPQQTSSNDIKEPWIILQGHEIPPRIIEEHPEALLITVVRHPLERAISQYFFVKGWIAANKIIPQWVLDLDTDSTRPLESFLLDEKTTNFQMRRLIKLKRSDFAFVGVTEVLDRFCQYFDKKSDVKLHRLNTATRPSLKLSDNVVDEFVRKNQDDYSLYHEALKRINAD